MRSASVHRSSRSARTSEQGTFATSRGVRCKRMFKIPETIDLEVVKLMKEADWPWDPLNRAFRQAARANESFADYVKRMQQNPP
jgi:hypothetical protein